MSFDWNNWFDVKKFTEAALLPAVKEIGNALGNACYLGLSGLEEKRIIKEAKLNELKQRLVDGLGSIEAENLTEPPFEIIGPAFEATKYYFDNDELREMFANLIVHSCDKNYQTSIHPSFVEILKQLSVLDARIIASFRPKTQIVVGTAVESGTRGDGSLVEKRRSPEHYQELGVYNHPEKEYPIVNYWLTNDNGKVLYIDNVIIFEDIESADLLSSSITNLLRLGLIDISYNQIKANYDYSEFERSTYYQTMTKKLIRDDTLDNLSITIESVRGQSVFGKSYDKIVIEKGIARLTRFGNSFIKTCAIESEIINNN